MSSIYNAIPDEVLQDITTFTCWAATAESWISRIPTHPARTLGFTKNDFITMYRGFTNDFGGLNIQQGFKALADHLSMEYDIYLNAGQLNAPYLYSKLLRHRYLYLFFLGGQTGLGNGLAHASVIYGISSSVGGKDVSLGIMDPWIRGIVPRQPLAHYQKARQLLIGWYRG